MTAAVRTIFFGTASFARASLEALARASFIQLQAVVSQPDRARGRHLETTPTPVKETALELGFPVLQPAKARSPETLAELKALEPGLIVVAAYGQILPQALLDIPTHGCLNVHGSLLPRYRGAAPIQWALLDGEPATGVTIMKMDAGLDTGPMLSKAATAIEPNDNAQTLQERLANMGAELLVKTIPPYLAGEIRPEPQPSEGATYASKIAKEQGLLRWDQPAGKLWNQIRAFTPWPGSYTFEQRAGKRTLLKILEATPAEGKGAPGRVLRADKEGVLIACAEGALLATVLQREGGRKLAARDFLAGSRIQPGDQLG